MYPRWPPAKQKESWSPSIDLHRDIVVLLLERSWFILVGKWTPELLVIMRISSGSLEVGAKTEFQEQKMYYRSCALKIKRKGAKKRERLQTKMQA